MSELVIRSVADLHVGDIGFTSIRGRVGAAILAGQTAIDAAALLRGNEAATAGWITHAFIVTTVDRYSVEIVEAMPGGARLVRLPLDTTQRIGPGFAYARLPELTIEAAAARFEAGRQAERMLGTPYGFGQYGAIAGLTLSGGRAASPTGPLARYVQRRDPKTGLPRRAICSQLVDEAYRLAGVHLFDDGRPPAYVTPGALFWQCARLGDVCVL